MNISDFLPATASSCIPRLRHILLHGGSASWIDGKHLRMICHYPDFHRPTKRLPWPLSLAQPHLIEFTISDTDQLKSARLMAKPIHRHIYKKAEIETAIRDFLSGAEPDTPVIFRDN